MDCRRLYSEGYCNGEVSFLYMLGLTRALTWIGLIGCLDSKSCVYIDRDCSFDLAIFGLLFYVLIF